MTHPRSAVVETAWRRVADGTCRGPFSEAAGNSEIDCRSLPANGLHCVADHVQHGMRLGEHRDVTGVQPWLCDYTTKTRSRPPLRAKCRGAAPSEARIAHQASWILAEQRWRRSRSACSQRSFA